jgi:capsular exopolysaccharide synthesis family protein
MGRYFHLLQRLNSVDELVGTRAIGQTSTRPVSQTVQIRTVPRAGASRGSSDSRYIALGDEEDAKLIQRVFLSQNSNNPRVVTCCSADLGNGSASVCARLAGNLATQVPGTICVLDANLRSPSLHHLFGIENLEGFTEAVLLDRPLQDYVRNVRHNLCLITAGTTGVHPHALLASGALRSKVKELRASFDYVLIDSPPATQYTDTSILAPLTDGVILVIEAESTRRETALSAKENIEAAHASVLAAVLNNRRFPVPEALYRRL